MSLQVTGQYRLFVERIANHDTTQTLLEIVKVGGQAKDCHHFGSNHNIKAILAHKPVSGSAKSDGDFSQGAIIHVDHPLPADLTQINIESIAMMNMIVN